MNERAARIGFVAPYTSLLELAVSAARDLPEPVWVAPGLLEEGVAVARRMYRGGVEVIVSRGGTAKAIMSSGIDLPVVGIPISGHDIARALQRAASLGGRIGVAEYPDMIGSVLSMAELLGVKVEAAPYSCFKEAGDAILTLLKSGVSVVVGETLTVQLATQYGAQGVLVESGIESVRQAIREALRTSGSMVAHKIRSRQMATLAELVNTGVVVVNSAGRVEAGNSAAASLLGVPRDQLPGLDGRALIGAGAPSRSGRTVILAPAAEVQVRSRPVSPNDDRYGWVVELERRDRHGRGRAQARPRYDEFRARWRLEDIIGNSAAIRGAVEMAARYARTGFSALLCGETGTGKELFAHGIHNASPRASGPFVAVNCAAIPGTLLESELFGYEEGAFTGAARGGKPGLFRMADGGTVFLDEICSMSLDLQARMLRVLEQRQVIPVGSDRVATVDVRIIAASNQDLRKRMADGSFREDLFHRLSTLTIEIPPLRERKGDIPVLVREFIERAAEECSLTPPNLEPDAVQALKDHHWPGNVRELLNVVRRLVIAANGGGGVTASMVRSVLGSARGGAFAAPAEPGPTVWGRRDLRALEKDAILSALQRSGWVRKEAARLLGISTTTLWRKLKSWPDVARAFRDEG